MFSVVKGTVSGKMARSAPENSLRIRCIQEATRVIEASGLEQLSLREVARTLGVSHQAPYKHFADRDALLADVIAAAYDELTERLRSRPLLADPAQDLGEIGRRYLAFAEQHPRLYRLLFDHPITSLPHFEQIEAKAATAFGIVEGAVGRLVPTGSADIRRQGALMAWAVVHGLASFVANDLLPLTGSRAETDVEAAMGMVCRAVVAAAASSEPS